MQKERITWSNPTSLVAEAYRVLVNNLTYRCKEDHMNTLLFTSCQEEEGTTTTIVNVGISLAQLGKKVLLVDGDIRKPSLHKIFDIDNGMGLTNIMTKHTEYHEYIKVVKDIDRISVLTSGPMISNPSDIFSSSKMDELLQSIKEEYDYVLFDMPNIGSISDTSILARKVDGVVVVVASGSTDVKTLQRVTGMLNKLTVNMIGAVLNKISKKTDPDYSSFIV